MEGITGMSFHGVRRHSLILAFTTSFKGFRNNFLKVSFDDYPELSLDDGGQLKFPLNWKSIPRTTRQRKSTKMDSVELAHIKC